MVKMKYCPIFESFYKSINMIDDEHLQLTAYKRIFEYVFNGVEDQTGEIIVDVLFESFRPTIDASIKRYTASSENGKKGGRKPKETYKNLKEPIQNKEKEKEKEKAMEKEMAMETEKESLQERENMLKEFERMKKK